MVRNRLDQRLEQLHVELIKMGSLCEEGIQSAVSLIGKQNPVLIKKVRQIEREIDHKEREIEGLCMKLLLQQQPVAKDLRTISSALKMISDLERIGDQAADIAEITEYLTEPAQPMRHLEEMCDAVCRMVTDSVTSFVKKDLEMAYHVIQEDDAVDQLFVQMRTDLTELIRSAPEQGQTALDLLMIAKYLERIGDHAVNLGEWVVYSIQGTHVEDAEE